MRNRKEEFSERMNEIKKQLGSRPSNCKHCKLFTDRKNPEWICGRTESQTFFGTKAEKCLGDCADYEKGIGELCRDMMLCAFRSKIKNFKAEPPCDTMENLKSWMNGYAQCQRDILGIIDSLVDKGE